MTAYTYPFKFSEDDKSFIEGSLILEKPLPYPNTVTPQIRQQSL